MERLTLIATGYLDLKYLLPLYLTPPPKKKPISGGPVMLNQWEIEDSIIISGSNWVRKLNLVRE